jgi:hypothetical protein
MDIETYQYNNISELYQDQILVLQVILEGKRLVITINLVIAVKYQWIDMI